MRFVRSIAITLSVLVPFASASLVLAQDVQGGKDHPLISRYPGSTIVEYRQKAFDEYEIPLSPVADGKYAKTNIWKERSRGSTTLHPRAAAHSRFPATTNQP